MDCTKCLELAAWLPLDLSSGLIFLSCYCCLIIILQVSGEGGVNIVF